MGGEEGGGGVEGEGGGGGPACCAKTGGSGRGDKVSNLFLGAARPGKSSNSSSTIGHDVAVVPRATPSPGTFEVSWCKVAIVSGSKEVSDLVSGDNHASVATIIFHKSYSVHF